MARRRRRHRNPINHADWGPILIGAVGGAMATYVWLKSQTSTPAGQTVSITTPTLPTVTQPTQTG